MIPSVLGEISVVDFVKLMAERKAKQAELMAAEKQKKEPTRIVRPQPSYLARFQHLTEHHLGQMTEWEANFCWTNIHYIKGQDDKIIYLSDRVQNKLAEIEALYCGTGCGA
jgi:hypothetical protein